MPDSAEPQGSPRSANPGLRYSAFISYTSRDAPAARRLHKRLETYRLPRRLAGNSPTVDERTHRIKPVFRDNAEMSAAYDLTAAVREAIAQSDFLIVVCSPRSAQSKWVGREIELFRALHGDTHILAALIDGAPDDAFHPALGGPQASAGFKPLAADFRRGASGQKLALLKLVAAVVGVGLDELLQRDSQRQIRRITAVAVGSVAGIAVVAVLAVAALNARAEAESQRLRAGGLGAFMLNDLRKGLKAAGRLDLQMAVNKAALSYYQGQDLSRLPADDLVQRAAALQAMGEDNEKRGDLKSAQAEFEEARRTTDALLAARPDDPKRIFAHAQSEYWVGLISWRNGDSVAARSGFESYATLARRLSGMDPTNDKWRREVGYAESNLGMLAMRQAGDLPRAERHFRAALESFQLFAKRKPADVDAPIDLADGYAWLADSQRLQGNYAEALKNRMAQRQILERLLESDARNVQVRANLVYNELALARIDADRGAPLAALERLDRGHNGARALQASDPANAEFAKESRVLELFKVRALLDLPKSKRPPGTDLSAILGSCSPAMPVLADDELTNFCTVLRARVLAENGEAEGAREALSKLRKPDHPEVYSKQWGLNLPREAAHIASDSNERK